MADLGCRWQSLVCDAAGLHRIAANQSRLFVSSDGGMSWVEAQPAGATDQSWYGLAVSGNAQIYLAGIYSGRLYLSTDAGNSWSEVQPAGDVDGTWESAAIDYLGNRMIVADTDGRIYMSSNSGTSWSEVRPNGDVNLDITSAAMSSDGTKIILGGWNRRLWVSTNSGSTWTEARPAGDTTGCWSVTCSRDGAYFGAADCNGRVYICATSGSSWTEIQPLGDIESSWYGIATDGTGDNWLVADYSDRVYLSTDGGTTWTDVTPTGDDDDQWGPVCMSSDGTRLGAAAGSQYGGIWHSQDSGVTWDGQFVIHVGEYAWTGTNPQATTSQNPGMLAASDDGKYLYIGTYGYRQWRSTDGGSTWTEMVPFGSINARAYIGCDGSGQHVYALGGPNYKVMLSGDYGASWTDVTPAGASVVSGTIRLTATGGVALLATGSYVFYHDGYQWWWPLKAGDFTCAALPSSSEYFWVGESNGRLYKGTFEGSLPSWEFWEVRPRGDENCQWHSIDVSDDGQVIVAGCRHTRVGSYWTVDAVYISTDGGSTWADRTPASELSPSVFQVSVARDGTQIICTGQTTEVFFSDDYGESWTDISPVNDTEHWFWKYITPHGTTDGTFLYAPGADGPDYYWLLGGPAAPGPPTPRPGEPTAYAVVVGSTVSTIITLPPFRPEQPITEKLSWATRILKANDGTLQRIPILLAPRQSFRLTYSLPDLTAQRKWDAYIHKRAKMKVGLPIWPEQVEHTATISAGATSITVDTRYADFRANSRAVIWQDNKAEIVFVGSKTDNSLTLSMPVVNTYTGSKLVMPCRVALGATVAKTGYASGACLVELDYEVVDNAPVTGYTPGTEYDGMEVLSLPGLFDDTSQEETDPDVIVYDNESGVLRRESVTDHNTVTFTHGFVNNTKAACWAFRQWLHYLKGRQKAFLVPTFARDFVLTRAVGSSDTKLYVTNNGYAKYMNPGTIGHYVGIQGASLLCRKITAAAEVDATEETLTIDALGDSVPDTALVCLAHPCLLASDTVEITWPTAGRNECNTRFTTSGGTLPGGTYPVWWDDAIASGDNDNPPAV